MKKLVHFLKGSGMYVALFMLICALIGVCDVSTADGAVAASAVALAGGGVAEPGEDQSITISNVDVEDLILKEIDPTVLKIRPVANPLGTISRHTSVIRSTKQKVVEYYSIDVLPTSSTLSTAVVAGGTQAAISTANDSIFAVNETILCLGVKGYKADQTTVDPKSVLVLYVVDRDSAGHPVVVPVNGKISSGVKNTFPAIAVGTKLLRAGRAASESQVRTESYSGYPTKEYQHVQKFITEIDVTTAYDEAKKEVRWEVSDVNEQAIFEMLTEQNNTFWLNKLGKLTIKNKYSEKAEETYFTEGIWWQMGKDFDFAGAPLDVDTIVSLMKTVFTGNASSKKKLLICGSELMAAFERVEYTNRVIREGTKYQMYGLEFTGIVSRFGTLLAIHDETFDRRGMEECGAVIDADFLTKWTHGWKVHKFDLLKAGVADKISHSIIEECGLILKNPAAHTRVYLNAATCPV